jgi:hypothetical protein
MAAGGERICAIVTRIGNVASGGGFPLRLL